MFAYFLCYFHMGFTLMMKTERNLKCFLLQCNLFVPIWFLPPVFLVMIHEALYIKVLKYSADFFECFSLFPFSDLTPQQKVMTPVLISFHAFMVLLDLHRGAASVQLLMQLKYQQRAEGGVVVTPMALTASFWDVVHLMESPTQTVFHTAVWWVRGRVNFIFIYFNSVWRTRWSPSYCVFIPSVILSSHGVTAVVWFIFIIFWFIPDILPKKKWSPEMIKLQTAVYSMLLCPF